MMRSTLTATAYHEAGHAVAAHVLKFPIRSVSIVQDLDTAGRMVYRSPLAGIRLDFDGSDRARLRAESAIIVALAGPAAQRRYSPRSVRSWHASGDYELAGELAMRVNGSAAATNAYLKWLQIRTGDLLAGRWRTVDALARALIEQKTIDGNSAVTAMNGSSTGTIRTFG